MWTSDIEEGLANCSPQPDPVCHWFCKQSFIYLEKAWTRLRGKRPLFRGVRGEGIQSTA